MRNCLGLLVCSVLIVSFTPAVHAADGKGPPNKKNNSRKESPQERAREQMQKQREEAERLRKAAVELAKEEQAAFAAANQEIAEAKGAHRESSKRLADAKLKATQDVEKSLGIEKAVAEMKAAQKAFDAAAEPVLKSVREGADYRTAKQKSAEAESAIKLIRDDASLTEAEKRTRVAELFPRTLATADLEKRAVKGHPAAAAANEKLETAQRRVADLRAKVDEKVEKDEAVRSARQAVEKTSTSMDRAEAKLAAVKSRAAAAEQRLQAGIVPRDKADKEKGPKKE